MPIDWQPVQNTVGHHLMLLIWRLGCRWFGDPSSTPEVVMARADWRDSIKDRAQSVESLDRLVRLHRASLRQADGWQQQIRLRWLARAIDESVAGVPTAEHLAATIRLMRQRRPDDFEARVEALIARTWEWPGFREHLERWIGDGDRRLLDWAATVAVEFVALGRIQPDALIPLWDALRRAGSPYAWIEPESLIHLRRLRVRIVAGPSPDSVAADGSNGHWPSVQGEPMRVWRDDLSVTSTLHRASNGRSLCALFSDQSALATDVTCRIEFEPLCDSSLKVVSAITPMEAMVDLCEIGAAGGAYFHGIPILESWLRSWHFVRDRLEMPGAWSHQQIQGHLSTFRAFRLPTVGSWFDGLGWDVCLGFHEQSNGRVLLIAWTDTD